MKKNKYLWFVVIALLAITILLISKTYALLENNANGDMDVDVGSWQIKLNGVDISEGITQSFQINNINLVANNNVESGYIAPGRSGYFDITIDPSGTEVAVRYDLFIDLASTEYPENIQISITDLTNNNAVLTATNTYTGVISLASINNNETITLRVNINWVNNSLYDATDTEIGEIVNNHITIPVEVSIQQYLGETIVGI